MTFFVNLLSMSPLIYGLGKLYCVVDQYGWKSELPENFSASLPYQILKNSVQWFSTLEFLRLI
jgi:hypothetical protein